MIAAFILGGRRMARRTLNLSDSIEELIREHAREGESFSAAAARLIQEGAARQGSRKPPRYVGAGSGPRDLGRLAEKYLRDLVVSR
jgi:hypothetical protein